jgi:toxin secretion/phage lysis holin
MKDFTEFMNSLKFTNDFWVVMLPSILMALDVATGFINAWAKNQIKSSVMRQGLARKFGELTIIAIGQLFFYGLGLPQYAVGFISFYIILMELVSIAENLDKLGVPIPKFIKKVLNNAEKKVNEIGTEEKETSKKKGGKKHEKSDNE